jgi:proline utilization trans-activator
MPQAVIHAVRPILLYMARQNRHSTSAQALAEMNPSLIRLAEICVETSSKMLVILKQLRAREILGMSSLYRLVASLYTDAPIAKHAFLDLDATFSVGFIFVLVEAIDPGKNMGLEGINGCRAILRYLADLGNRAA